VIQEDLFPDLLPPAPAPAVPLEEPSFEKGVEDAKKVFPFYDFLAPARQAVIATMGQIFGEQGLYHWGTFKEFCAVGDWANAKKELVLSQWHEEAPNSVERLANQLLTGEWA